MKNLIQEKPRTISFAKQVGVIVGAYLLFWIVGHLSLMALPADARSVIYPGFYGFFVHPVRGVLITGIVGLLCFMGWLLMQCREIMVATVLYVFLLLALMVFGGQSNMAFTANALKAPVVRVIEMF